MALYVPITEIAGDDPQLRKIEGKQVTLETDSIDLEPPYVEKLDLELSTNTDTVSDQCGHTETQKRGDSNTTLTMSGIITDNELSDFKALRYADTITVTSPIESGEFVVQDPTVSQKDDLNFLQTRGDGGTIEEVGNAFVFQLQLKEASSTSSTVVGESATGGDNDGGNDTSLVQF